MRVPPYRIGVFASLAVVGVLLWHSAHRVQERVPRLAVSPASEVIPRPAPDANRSPAAPMPVPAATGPGATAPVTTPVPATVSVMPPDAGRTPVLREFGAWLARWESGADIDEAGWAEAARLAAARREWMRDLIVRNPKAALAEASTVSWSQRRKLPAAVASQLEEWVSGVGRYEVLCAQVLPGQAARPGAGSSWYRTFTLGDRVFRASVYGRRLEQMTTERAALFGVAIDDVLAVSEEAIRRVDSAEAKSLVAEGRVPAGARCVLTGVAAEALPGGVPVLAQHGATWLPLAAETLYAPLSAQVAADEPGFRPNTMPPAFQQWSHGVKRLLFMRARFPDDLREPISEAEAAEVMRMANDHFVESSYNSLSLITTVGPLVMLPQPKLYYAVAGPGALLADARAATRAAGIETDAFELDVVRHENVPGFDWGGLGALGGKGSWLQSSGLGVVVHELGHNLGLAHANFWNTVRPGTPPDQPALPPDADSMVGIDSAIGAGDDVEYGDPYDVMGGGGGDAHFSGLHKYLLGWVPSAGLTTVTTNGVYRVAAHDLGVMGEVPLVLRIRKDAERFYWISTRARSAGNAWQGAGVEVHWNRWHQAIGTTALIDTTPGSGNGKDDAALTLGRTFSDEGAEVHITPVAAGMMQVNGRIVPYYDVAVNLGPFAGNQKPSLELAASPLAVTPGTPVRLQATGSDPDGDRIAYSWDLGSGVPAPRGPTAGMNIGETTAQDPTLTYTWNVPGEYVVRCEATDMKGGIAARHLVVRVGLTSRLRISGQVIDQSGQPLAGVRVHNGRYGTNSPYAPEFRWAYTDSDGRYTMTDLEPGDYEVGGELAGYRVSPLNFIRPLVLNEFTGVDVAFLAAAVPRVTVTRTSDGAESPAAPATFRIARSGPTNAALRVFFRLAGAAREGEDYTPWAPFEVQTNRIQTLLGTTIQVLTNGYADLGPGMTSTNVSIAILPDTAAEGDESLLLTLQYPVTRTIMTETETNFFDLPGWQVQADNGRDKWFQTRQEYQFGPRSEAEAKVRDGSPAPSATTISIVALDTEMPENTGDSATFLILRGGRVPTGALRIPILLGGTATAGDDYELPAPAITLPAGVDSARLVVRVLDDRFVEGNETVTVTLGTGTGYTLGTRSATAAIVDNDLPLVSITATDPVVDEGAGDPGARVTFQRLGDRSTPLEIDYLIGGSATAGRDYVALPGRVVIPTGVSSVTIFVQPLDDAQLEGNETVEVQLGDSPVYNPVQPARAVVTLRDDEFPVVTVESSVARAVEGGEAAEFLFRRSGPVSSALTVRYRFAGSAVHQADFVSSGDRIVFGVGQQTATITVTPIDDGYREDDEEIILELLPDPAYTLGTPSDAGIPLEDNGDSELAVGFALLSSRALESRPDPEVVVRISGNPDEGADNAVTVDWEVLGGSATLGTDYILTNGTVSFPWADPASETPLTNRIAVIPLQVIDDLLPEADETVVIRLRIAPTVIPAEDPEQEPTIVTNGVLDVFAFHTFTILDDDLSEWSVTATNRITREGGDAPGRFVVRRTGRTNLTQSVTVFLSGLAAPGSDYTALSNRVVLRPGEITSEVLVVPVDDPLMEFEENVVLRLVDAPGARIGEDSVAEILIQDNDGTIEFTGARLNGYEGDGEAVIRIRRNGDTSLAASAVLDVVPGTATPASLVDGVVQGDFHPTNLVVSFGPGVLEQVVRLPLVNDDVPELPETVGLRLSHGSSLFPLGGQNSAVLTLLDDDALISAGTNDVAGIESRGVFPVRLERTGPVDAPLVIAFETADASAVAGEDYARETGTVQFPVGERTAEVPIRLLDDLLIEGDEVFFLRLSTTEGSSVSEVPVTIVDDDCTLEFAAETLDVDEDAGVAEITVVRLGSTLNPVAVDFATSPGTALAGQDFEATAATLRFLGNRFEALTNGTGVLEFRRGETNQTLTVRILNDAEGERDETLQVTLLRPRSEAGAGVAPFLVPGTLTNVVVTIRDNEAPGRLDDAFHPGLGADATVRTLGLQSDGKVLVGGDFTKFDGLVLPRLARLHADGFVDNSFNPGRGFDGSVLAVTEEHDGRIFVGGTFSNLDGAAQPFLARLEPDGTRSTGFNPAPNGVVRALATGATGAPDYVYAGGEFSRIGGLAVGGVARFTSAGALDASFAPAPESGRVVQALAVQAGSEGDLVLVGGTFANWLGTGNRHLVRLLPDGSPDPAWSPGFSPDGPVRALARAADGTVYMAGAFASVAGIPRAGLARLLASGAVDASFDPGPGGTGPVLALGPQTESRVIVAGTFDQYQEATAGRFLRLLASGTGDAAFFRGTGADDAIRAVVVQPDGAVVLGGDFTSINGRPRLRVARLHAEEKFLDGFVEFTHAVFTAGENATEAVVTVRRSGAAKGTAKVGYRTLDATARAGEDYVAATGELEFPPGVTNRTFRVAVRDDLLPEGNEAVLLVLTNLAGAQPGRQSTATLVIQDDEAAVAFELPAVEVGEDATPLQLVVRRSGPLGAAAQVDWRTLDDTALAGADFEAGSGRLEFTPDQATALLSIPLVNDTFIEGTERFRVVLETAGDGLQIGSQAEVIVSLLDDDRPPTHYNLILESSPGGRVVPGGGRFPTNAVVELRALPDRGFELARWEGTVASSDNPLTLLMDRNHVLTARFRARSYLETFESGALDQLPWQPAGDAGWIVTNETASSGVFSARSGSVRDGGRSGLLLERDTPAGGASFDFRASTEPAWDFLEFHLNGTLVQRWSGILGWQTFQFNVPAGRNRFEWRFQRDRSFGGELDAVWIDNLDLPETFLPAEPPRIALPRPGSGCVVEIQGTPGRLHVLESSSDLRTWHPVTSLLAPAATFVLGDPDCGGPEAGARFYRVRVED